MKNFPEDLREGEWYELSEGTIVEDGDRWFGAGPNSDAAASVGYVVGRPKAFHLRYFRRDHSIDLPEGDWYELAEGDRVVEGDIISDHRDIRPFVGCTVGTLLRFFRRKTQLPKDLPEGEWYELAVGEFIEEGDYYHNGDKPYPSYNSSGFRVKEDLRYFRRKPEPEPTPVPDLVHEGKSYKRVDPNVGMNCPTMVVAPLTGFTQNIYGELSSVTVVSRAAMLYEEIKPDPPKSPPKGFMDRLNAALPTELAFEGYTQADLVRWIEDQS